MRLNAKSIQKFLALESSSAVILLVMALIAMIWANSPLGFIHARFIDASLFWINEGLMAIFFLLVGLELKKGYISGQLSTPSQVSLPLFAALGGMLIPASIYYLINYHDPDAIKGWATPVATDIAFALGVLSLFGKRVPIAIKLFLLALAIFDDIGAILIIAFFYSHGLVYSMLLLSLVLIFILFIMNRLSIKMLIPYIATGVLLWFCFLKAGVHPTLSGVILALAIPDHKKNSPLNVLEDVLHPYVAYLIMPLFALANAGFSLQGITPDILTSGIVLGITLGLFVGKQLGVFGFSWLLIRLRIAKLPEKSSWLELYGVSLLCGIGFTMSLFLGTLSFQNNFLCLAEVRLGVVIGSVLSGLAGTAVLYLAFARENRGSTFD